jgi:uncharacterized protein Veg
LQCPLSQIIAHTPRQVIALLREAGRLHAQERLERLQETYSSIAACLSQDGSNAFTLLQESLLEMSEPVDPES